MTGTEFKIELLKRGIKQSQLPLMFNISLKTANTICNATTVSKVYELALVGWLALNASKDEN